MFAWLDRAIAERSWSVAFLNVDPVLDRYRDGPARFEGSGGAGGAASSLIIFAAL